VATDCPPGVSPSASRVSTHSNTPGDNSTSLTDAGAMGGARVALDLGGSYPIAQDARAYAAGDLRPAEPRGSPDAALGRDLATQLAQGRAGKQLTGDVMGEASRLGEMLSP
jgi:hypothetical protein